MRFERHQTKTCSQNTDSSTIPRFICLSHLTRTRVAIYETNISRRTLQKSVTDVIPWGRRSISDVHKSNRHFINGSYKGEKARIVIRPWRGVFQIEFDEAMRMLTLPSTLFRSSPVAKHLSVRQRNGPKSTAEIRLFAVIISSCLQNESILEAVEERHLSFLFFHRWCRYVHMLLEFCFVLVPEVDISDRRSSGTCLWQLHKRPN